MRRIIVDTREPWSHPWAEYLPEGFQLERGTLETGDIALTALPPKAVVVERKTPTDLASCIGSGRERFERELRRGRYVGRLIVVIEGGLADVSSRRKASNRQLSDIPLAPLESIPKPVAAYTAPGNGLPVIKLELLPGRIKKLQ
ncbi:MAG: ERCC4 domain-containing protein [Terrimicrobiaceae bacterium]